MSQSDRKRSTASTVSRTSHASLHDITDYQQTIKKLSKDKSSLKEKLRRLLDDVDAKNKEHQVELEKTQDYFQDQVGELTEERNRLQEENEQLQANFDKLRQDCERKLNKQKETLKTTKDPSIKRLETTIADLQAELKEKNDDIELTKQTTEEYYAQREDEWKAKNEELQQQIAKLIKEQREMLKTHTTAMEQLTIKFNREKQQEIDDINTEKNTALINLQNTRDICDKRVRALEQQHNEQLSQTRFESEKLKLTTERKLAELSAEFRQTLDDVKREYEGKIFEKDRQSKLELDKANKESERQIQNLTDESKRRLEGVLDTTKREIDDLKAINKKLTSELENITQRVGQETSLREEDIKKRYEQQIERLTNEWQGRLEQKEKDLNEQKLRNEKIVGERDDINDMLKSQVQQLQINLKKVQDNSQNMNNQFVASLNKQKETAEEEISRRDNIINAQERQLKKIADESLDRINSLERKYKLIVDENKDYIDKISQMKTSSDQKTLALETTKAEVQRLREIADKLVEKTKQLENEKDSLLNKHQLDRDSYDKKIKILETGQRNRDQEFVKYKDDSIKLVQVESKYRDEISRLNDQLLRVKTELETKSGTLEDIQTKFTALQANAHQLLLKNKDLDIDLDKKDKELRISKNELEIANRNANSSFTEMTKFRNNMNEEMKAKMADKDKQIADLLRKVSHAEQSIKLLEQNREQLTHKLNTAVTERDNTKQLIDTFSGPNSEYKLKCKELEKLKEDLDNIKKQFATTISNMSQESKSKEEGYKAEINKLQARINAYELQNTQTEQRIERMKLEFLKELNEAKRMPPEDQEKLNKALRDREDLVLQLNLETKKLESLQFEYANKSAEIKIKSKYLEDKEAELKRAEQAIKSAPPKLIDPELRKSRDEALASLRAVKLELGQLKDESIQLGQKLQVAEGLVKELEREKSIMMQSHKELKETFVNNLNQQQTKHEQEMKGKDDRIKELETLLTEKIKGNSS